MRSQASSFFVTQAKCWLPAAICVWLYCGSFSLAQDGPYFASGIKVGEVSQESALVWLRLTREPQARFDRLDMFTEGVAPAVKDRDVFMPTDVVPGMEGQARVVYWPESTPEQQTSTGWQDAVSSQDFILQFELSPLQPGTNYVFRAESRRRDQAKVELHSEVGRFSTPAVSEVSQPIRFVVTTCQAIRSVDSGTDGHKAYLQMLAFRPDFFVHTGDIVYYDKLPLCQNLAQARAKWNLMFAYGYKRKFHRQVPAYFMKDDHDTLKNDCWAGQTYGDLTFEQGLGIFREQVPMGEQTFRTIRWGQDVQIWLTENRDFRSPNTMEDGPSKTILGAEQKAWLKRTMAASNATFKFLISPGPIVGPDKRGKADNHSNAAFATEGAELRAFLSDLPNTYVICGDRHWQYCSQDPQSGLLEFGCGPINDEHDFGGDPGENPEYHRYFGSRGGFLGITVDGNQADAIWFSTDESSANEDGLPQELHRERLEAAQ